MEIGEWRRCQASCDESRQDLGRSREKKVGFRIGRWRSRWRSQRRGEGREGSGGEKVSRVGWNLDGASRGPETKFQKQTCGWGEEEEKEKEKTERSVKTRGRLFIVSHFTLIKKPLLFLLLPLSLSLSLSSPPPLFLSLLSNFIGYSSLWAWPIQPFKNSSLGLGPFDFFLSCPRSLMFLFSFLISGSNVVANIRSSLKLIWGSYSIPLWGDIHFLPVQLYTNFSHCLIRP